MLASMFPPDQRADLDAAWRAMSGRVDGSYANFESRLDAAAVTRVYPGQTGERVRAAWRRYDPDGVLRPFS